MTNIKMLVDRLMMKQEHSNLVFSHSDDGGFKIEEHWVEEDTDGSTLILLNKEETAALTSFLNTKKID